MTLSRLRRAFYDYRPAALDPLFTARALARKNRILRSVAAGATRPGAMAIERRDGLPRLAWAISRSADGCVAAVGPGVETFGDGFFEGVWAGPFDQPASVGGAIRFGTGARSTPAGVTLFPMSNPLEPIFVLVAKRAGVAVASNSLAFGVACAEEACGKPLVERLEGIVADNHAATAVGVLKYNPIAYEDDDLVLVRVLCDTVEILHGGQVRLTASPRSYAVADFRQYEALLAATLAKAFGNGADAGRRTRLAPLTSITRGYDSTASSVIAFKAGCRKAVTLDVVVYGEQDSGKVVGEQFGLSVEEFPHVAGNRIDNLQMAFGEGLLEAATEFIATVGHGDDVTFKAFESALGDTVFVSGAWGDSIWARDATVYPGLPVRILYGKSVNEFRLRVGFAHVPLPMVGALYPRSIVRISQSAEMKPFSVGGGYDRPIPRRIAEEAGVRRESFGNTKRATAPDAPDVGRLWVPSMRRMVASYRAALR